MPAAPLFSREEVRDLLAEFDDGVSVVFVEHGAYDAGTDTRPVTTQTVMTGGKVSEFSYAEASGSLDPNSQFKVTIPNISLPRDPRTSDRVIVGGTEHEILAVRATWTGGQIVLFRLTVAKPGGR